MLTIDHSARTEVQAPPERCLDLLADVASYPEWASLIQSAGPAAGDPDRVSVRAELMGLGFEMNCALELGADRAVLRRIPDDDGDEERYEATWTLTARGPQRTAVELHVAAVLDAPGPARLLRGRVERRLVEDLLADFERAATEGHAGNG